MSRIQLPRTALALATAFFAASGCSSSTAPQASVPAAPTGLLTSAADVQITLRWTNVSGATSYNLYWSTTTGVTPATGTKIAAAANPYTQGGLTNGTTYYYVATAVNAAGESAASAEASDTPPGIPAAPTGVIATPGNAQVTVSWAAVTGATSYNVYWSDCNPVTRGVALVVNNASSPYVQPGLTNGVPYYLVVTAVNIAGESPFSTQVTATPAVPGPGSLARTAPVVSC